MRTDYAIYKKSSFQSRDTLQTRGIRLIMCKKQTSYEDIINLPYSKSDNRPHMSMNDRAAQFGAFAALTGFEDEIEEASRLTWSINEMEEYELTKLNEKMMLLKSILYRKPCVTVTYFEPDEKKEGGAYKTVTRTVKKMDDYAGELIFEDGSRIQIGMIYYLSIEDEDAEDS